MLGLLLLYFIGKPFYELAERHHKNKWLFAILSIVAYYAGGFVTGIILVIIVPDSVDTMNNLVLSLISMPLGLLFAWMFYRILENSWTKLKDNHSEDDILDQNLHDTNQSI